MVTFKDFLAGLIAGFLYIFVTPYISWIIPTFPFSYYIVQPIFFGIWVVIAELILEKVMKT